MVASREWPCPLVTAPRAPHEGMRAVQYEGSALSPGTRAVVEEEVQVLIQAAYTRAQALIKANEDKLHTLATALCERETLSGDQIRELLGLPASPS